MDSQFGEVFLFLTNLAWKCRITLPVLVTAVFMAMDIRLQIEINIQTGPVGMDVGELDDYSDEEEWETTDTEGSDTED